MGRGQGGDQPKNMVPRLYHGTNYSEADKRGLTPYDTGLTGGEKRAVYLTDSADEAGEYGGFVYEIDAEGLDPQMVEDFATEGGTSFIVTKKISPRRIDKLEDR